MYIERLLHLSPAISIIAVCSDADNDGLSETGFTTHEAKMIIKNASGHLIEGFQTLLRIMQDEPTFPDKYRKFYADCLKVTPSELKKKLTTVEGFKMFQYAARRHMFVVHSQSGGSFMSFLNGVGHFFKKGFNAVASIPLAAAKGVSTVLSHPFETVQAVSGLTDSVSNLAGNIAPMAELA